MITELPPDTPVTAPVDELTVATDVVPLVHVPDGIASANVDVVPITIVVVPVMAAGVDVLTETVVVTNVVPQLLVLV